LIIPVASPAADLDIESAVSAAQNFANGIGPIHHSGRDQRVDNGAFAVPSELYAGTEGHLIDPELQWPKLYNPTSNETSCRPAVSSSTTNIERVNYSVQKPLDQRVEGGDGEGQPQIPTVFHNVDANSLDLSEHKTEKPPTRSICQITKVCFAEPPLLNPSRIRTTRGQTKRKRIICSESGGSPHLPLAGKMEALSDLSDKTMDKFRRIAGPEIVATLWYHLRAQRCSPSNKQPRAILKNTHPFDTSIEGQLSGYQLEYENTETSNENFIELPRRLYFAKITGLYMKETMARRRTKSRCYGMDCSGSRCQQS
jgi:hypothetical protein